MRTPKVTDSKIEEGVSVLLRAGVLVSGIIVLLGGIYFVFRHGGERVDFITFRGETSIDRDVVQIVVGAFRLRARSIIQVGILALIATPILRVAFSLVGFALERDRVYVLITGIVLLILLYSLISGAVSA